ncbi:hypothetical protein O9993_12160 [Vibrio lentus]|nr:hypothetical protein [Vibrio lentus]
MREIKGRTPQLTPAKAWLDDDSNKRCRHDKARLPRIARRSVSKHQADICAVCDTKRFTSVLALPLTLISSQCTIELIQQIPAMKEALVRHRSSDTQ